MISRFFRYSNKVLRLQRITKEIGDGRIQPQIPGSAIWLSIALTFLLRLGSLNALEEILSDPRRRAKSLRPGLSHKAGCREERISSMGYRRTFYLVDGPGECSSRPLTRNPTFSWRAGHLRLVLGDDFLRVRSEYRHDLPNRPCSLGYRGGRFQLSLYVLPHRSCIPPRPERHFGVRFDRLYRVRSRLRVLPPQSQIARPPVVLHGYADSTFLAHAGFFPIQHLVRTNSCSNLTFKRLLV